MATGTLGTVARDLALLATHYARLKILGAAGNATYNIVTVPAGANILRILTMVRTVFSGGVPTISFGPSGTPAGYFAAAGGPITTAGRTNVTLIATGTLSLAADTVIVGVVGGGPNAGDADLEVEFTVNRDN